MLYQREMAEVTVSQVNLFERPSTITGIVGHEDTRIYPDAGYATKAPGVVRFTIDDSKRMLTEMILMLTTRWKVTKANGTGLTVANNVAPLNAIHYTMWSDCSAKVGNTIVAGNDGTFAYKTYLETCLGYCKEAKETWLSTMILYYQDTAAHFDDLTDANKGFESHRDLVENGVVVETRGKLPLDICQANRYLIPGMPMVISLTHASDNFRLLTATADLKPILQIKSIYLTLRRIMVSASIFLAIEQNLNSGLKALYPIKRSLIVSHQLITGTTHFNSTLFLGQKPSFVFIGFVRSDAYNGTYARNPFFFDSVDIGFAQINFEGTFYPQIPFEPGYGEKLFHLQYMYEEFQKLCGTLYTNIGNGLTGTDFKDGTTLFSFNLCETEPTSILREPYRDGHCRFEVKFNKAITRPYNLVAFGVFSNEMSISSEWVVSINYLLGTD